MEQKEKGPDLTIKLAEIFDPERGHVGFPLYDFALRLMSEINPALMADIDRAEKEDPQILNGDTRVGDIRLTFLWLGFTLGFAFGREFEINDRETISSLDALMERIYGEGIIPLRPRTRKTECQTA